MTSTIENYRMTSFSKIVTKQSNIVLWITAVVMGAFLVVIVVTIVTVLARKTRGIGRQSDRPVSYTPNDNGQINISPTQELTATSSMSKAPSAGSNLINLIVPRNAT